MRPKKKGKGIDHEGPYRLLAGANCPDMLSEMGAIIGFEQRGWHDSDSHFKRILWLLCKKRAATFQVRADTKLRAQK